MTALLIDLDGVLYEADAPIAGAAAAIQWLRKNDVPHLFLTNTTSRPRAAIVAKLAGMGIDASEEDILTPPVAAVRWLSANAPGPAALFVEPVVLGKPARPFFETAIAILDSAPGETLMVGDDIQGDIGGAQAAGIAGALVRTGKFPAEDLTGDIRPGFVLSSFAELPERWGEFE